MSNTISVTHNVQAGADKPQHVVGLEGSLSAGIWDMATTIDGTAHEKRRVFMQADTNVVYEAADLIYRAEQWLLRVLAKE